MIDKRLMYAQGQRVAKTMDGSRPGYRGSDYGDQARGTGAYSGGDSSPAAGGTQGGGTRSGNQNTGSASTDRSRTTPTQDYNTAVATGQNPLGIDMSKGPPDLTPKEIEFNINKFAPAPKKGFGILDIGLMLATGGLFGTKAKTAAQLFGTAKRTNNLVNTLSNTFGFENPIANMFSRNKTPNNKSIKSVNKTGTGETKFGGGDGDGQNGIADLEAISLLENEYILLLQKLQAGSISENDKSRFGVLKQMLGK